MRWLDVGDRRILYIYRTNDISMNKFTMTVQCTHCMRDVWDCDAMRCDGMQWNWMHIANTYQTMRAPILNRSHLFLSLSLAHSVDVCVGAWRISIAHKRIAQDTQATYKGAQLTNATILNHTHFKFRFGFFLFLCRTLCFIAKYDGTIYRQHQLFRSKRTTSIWLDCILLPFLSLSLFRLFFSIYLV